MTDLDTIAKRLEKMRQEVVLIGFVPMTFEQAEDLLFNVPGREDNHKVYGIPYFLTRDKGRPFVDNTGDDGGF
jgi:hypothetical protein